MVCNSRCLLHVANDLSYAAFPNAEPPPSCTLALISNSSHQATRRRVICHVKNFNITETGVCISEQGCMKEGRVCPRCRRHVRVRCSVTTMYKENAANFSQVWREDYVESTESLVFSSSGKHLVIAVAIEYRSQEIRGFKKAFSSFQK
jgi:hypothetical protein